MISRFVHTVRFGASGAPLAFAAGFLLLESGATAWCPVAPAIAASPNGGARSPVDPALMPDSDALLDASVDGDCLRIDFTKPDSSRLESTLVATEGFARAKADEAGDGPRPGRAEAPRAAERGEHRGNPLKTLRHEALVQTVDAMAASCATGDRAGLQRLVDAQAGQTVDRPEPEASHAPADADLAVNPRLLLDACVNGELLRIDFMRIDPTQIAEAIASSEQLLKHEQKNLESGSLAGRAAAVRTIDRCRFRLDLLRRCQALQKPAARAAARLAELQAALEVHRTNGAETVIAKAESEIRALRKSIASHQDGVDLDQLRIRFGQHRGELCTATLYLPHCDVARDIVVPRRRDGSIDNDDVWGELGKMLDVAHKRLAQAADPSFIRTYPNVEAEYAAYMKTLNAMRAAWRANDREGLQRLMDEELKAGLDLTELARPEATEKVDSL